MKATIHRYYWLNIGQLEPGTYDIITVADVTQPVFDGWDWYGPDGDYSGLEGHCALTVGDESRCTTFGRS